MHMSPLRNLLLRFLMLRNVRLIPSNPRNYRIAESPNRRGAHFDRIANREALLRDSARFGQPCRPLLDASSPASASRMCSEPVSRWRRGLAFQSPLQKSRHPNFPPIDARLVPPGRGALPALQAATWN